MDRQPLTDRLGDRLLAEYGGAAAAYSLRALNGNGDNVVRVRRASDNDEKDFTALQVSSGELTNWVNSQIVPPLDIGIETEDGRIPVPEGGTSIGTPAAAYSLRNLSTTYTGNVVDVRRSSDGNTQGFTAEEVSDGTLEAWVGAGNDGTVSKWYDQSGNTNHAVQTTPANQPTIVEGGSLVTGDTGEPAFVGDGVDDILSFSSSIDFATGEFFVSTVADVNTGGALIGSAIPNWLLLLTTSSIQVRSSNTNTIYIITPDSPLTAGESYLISLSRVGDDITAYVNGVAQADVETVVSTDTFSVDRLLQRGTNNNPYPDPVSEIIIYDSDQSDNRTAIEANIGETYGITGIPAYDNTVDGFVETWYDQSGNGRDAVQSVAGNQPKIVDGGSLILINGKPCVDGDGIGDSLNLTALSLPNTGWQMAWVSALAASFTDPNPFGSTSVNNRISYYSNSGTATSRVVAGSFSSDVGTHGSIAANTQTCNTLDAKPTEMTANINGTSQTAANALSNENSLNTLMARQTSSYNGYPLQEVIVYANRNQTVDDVMAAQNEYYGSY